MTALHDRDPRTEVAQLRKIALPDVVDAELVVAPTGAVTQTSGARAVVARIADRPLPTPRGVLMAVGWWSGRLAKVVPWLPLLLLREVLPVLRGVGKVAAGWARWVTCAELAAAVKEAKENERSKAAERLAKRKSGRLWGSVVVLLAAVGLAWWFAIAQPTPALLVAIVAVVVLDVVGRGGRTGGVQPVILPAGPIAEGMSLSSLRAEIVKSLVDAGVEATVALPVPVEHGWTVDYHARQAIDDDHLRQLERDLHIRRSGITQIVEPGNAARGQLQVMLRDPLARIVDSPDLGELSIYQMLPLGVTASGREWAEKFLRTHFTEVGASQSGKSSGFWQIVDVLRRCPEQELDGIDLTDGPAFSACRRAFRRRATDEAGAKRILVEAQTLCKERNAELSRLADDDDTPDEFEEKWQPTREHPQRTILIDEFARLAEDEELLKLVEYLLRYGAKAAVTVGIAGQGATLADFGTSIVRSQVMLKILFACSRRDVLDLFGKDARDAGYRPDLFEPANGTDIQDAGKCFVMSANSTTPEPRRAYRLEQSEVRRRDRQLGGRVRASSSVDAVEVPPALTLLERCLGDLEFVPTQDVLDATGGKWTAKALATELGKWGVSPAQHRQTKARGYWRSDVQRAIREL